MSAERSRPLTLCGRLEYRARECHRFTEINGMGAKPKRLSPLTRIMGQPNDTDPLSAPSVPLDSADTDPSGAPAVDEADLVLGGLPRARAVKVKVARTASTSGQPEAAYDAGAITLEPGVATQAPEPRVVVARAMDPERDAITFVKPESPRIPPWAAAFAVGVGIVSVVGVIALVRSSQSGPRRGATANTAAAATATTLTPMPKPTANPIPIPIPIPRATATTNSTKKPPPAASTAPPPVSSRDGLREDM